MRLRTRILLSTALMGLTPAAYAQTSPTAPADDEPATYRNDEIVVTAQKRSESINDVASSVTAFTAEARQKIGIDGLSDFAKFTPGLSYDAGADRVFLRGIGRQTNTAGSDPGVATYVDGIYDSSTVGLSNSDFFIERVEVLRGPQGTLYGRNSIGGALNAISRRPSDTLTIEGRGTYGNYDAYVLEGAISGPVTGGLRARLAASWSDQNKGYFRNIAGGPSEGGVGNNLYVEGQVEADLGPDATLWLKAFTGRSTSRPRSANFLTPYDYEPYSDVVPGAAFGYLLPGYQALGTATANPGADNPREFSTDTVSRSRLRGNFGGSAQLDVRLDPFDIRILGGYREYRFDSTADLDNTAMRAYDFPLSPGAVCGFIPGCTPLRVQPSSTFNYLEDRSYGSAEINFLSKGTGNLNWIAGLYYFAEELKQESRFTAEDQPQMRAPANGPANPGGDFVYAGTRLKMSSYAAFGQIDWDVTETLRLTGGLRYTYDEKQAIEGFRVVCLGCAPDTSPDQLGSFTLDHRHHEQRILAFAGPWRSRDSHLRSRDRPRPPGPAGRLVGRDRHRRHPVAP
ncbi:TonB-dependent receptor [Sphingopyxis sp. PET50]|uniref:TonB-dependent receptor n=1 Tax=Sphingopyxis sp. PET50 TaxID=2976533 RepID=UPI0021AECDF9|nr:TonB-dependent receptor [Sphingopyxis sp. PET50]